jgi:hypothetical protein
MSEPIALRAVFGQDEANHGTMRYRVDVDGLVRVPREAACFLIGNGGFALANTTAAAIVEVQPSNADPNPLVRLHHDDAGGCSYAGCEYPSDESGNVLVPPEAAAVLAAHGFVPVLEDGRWCGAPPLRELAATGKRHLGIGRGQRPAR